MHPAEAHADGDHHQSDHGGDHVCARRHIKFIDDGEDQQHQQARADELVEESRLRQAGKSWEGCEYAGRPFQVGVDLHKSRMIVPKHHGGRGKSSRGLRQGIRNYFCPRKFPEYGKGQGHRGIQVCSGDFPRDIDSHRHPQSPAESDVGKSAMNRFAGIVGREEHHHGHDARTEQD